VTADGKQPPSGPPASVLAARLAPEPQEGIPTVDELGLGAAKRVGFEWQQQRSLARWNEIVASLGTGSSDWVREIHGIFGAVGEQVLVATEAEVEKAIASRRLATLPDGSDSTGAALSRSLRFFAEGQGNALVVAGHGLANLTARTLALDPAFDASHLKQAQILPADFVPRSEAKGAWTSLTHAVCAAMVQAASAYAPDMQALAAELADVQADPAVRALFDLRNTQYHRWRGESPGVTGVNLKGATIRETLKAGQAVGLTSEMLPSYTEGQQALDELVRVTRQALDATVARLPGYHQAWHDAFAGAVVSSR
jgi:hypothetical protein